MILARKKIVLDLRNVVKQRNLSGFSREKVKNQELKIGLGAFGVASILGAAFYLKRQNQAQCATQPASKLQYFKTVRSDLPTFKRVEVSKHNNIENRVWVTYGIGVYDITDFIPKHPGANNIMIGAGEAIDPFWYTYQQHNTVEILKLLETYRIGNLTPDEAYDTSDLFDPWQNEPKRPKELIAASEKPFNAEPTPDKLVESFQTPEKYFYIRNHLPVPEIDLKTYELELSNEFNGKTITLKLEDLKKYKKHTVTAAIMCGGNRRSEMMHIRPVKGLRWGQSAVGNGSWTGVKLSEVLADLGVEADEKAHIHFEGLDTDATYTPYAASIPLSKALDPRGDVLLAFEMNGQPLSRDHGFPLRVVVPGVVGARNVKWLGRIVISKDESNSHWQQKDYKGFSPNTDWDTAEWEKSPAIQNMPVTSAICTPKDGDKVKVKNGCIELKGYAWSGGGNKIVRVDITTDEGKTWHVAELEQEESPAGRHWGWSLWTIKVPVDVKDKEVKVWAKAVDSNYNVQPETFENIFNFRGVLSNAYHRIKVEVSK